MTETDWKLLAVERGVDLNILETALIEIEQFRPIRNSGDPYMQIAGYAMKRTREALALLAESRTSPLRE
jgi:hypothetical protein